MPSTLVMVLTQVSASLQVLRQRAAQSASMVLLAMTLVAIAAAPGEAPGFWTWAGLLLVAGLTILATATFVASRTRQIAPADRQHRLTAAVTVGVVALIVNLFFGFWTTVLLAVGLVMIARQAARLRPGVFPWVLCATLVVLVPWWIWGALDAWHPGLLLLIPLAALAYLAGSHIREAYDDGAHRVLSTRGHRLGAWLAMLAGGLLVVMTGLVAGTAPAWIGLGGATMAAAVTLEAGISRPANQPGKYANAISDTAFVITAICWLISIV